LDKIPWTSWAGTPDDRFKLPSVPNDCVWELHFGVGKVVFCWPQYI
jgi:hypothetical protein